MYMHIATAPAMSLCRFCSLFPPPLPHPFLSPSRDNSVVVALAQGETKTSAACKKCDISGINEAPIDVFFCNAADVDPRPLCSTGDRDLTRAVAMNLCTPLLQVKHVLPSMVDRGFGAICFSNSLAAFVPIYGFAAYSATKSALKAFAEAINQEVAGTGVLVANAFMPSVETPGYQREKQVRHRVSEIRGERLPSTSRQYRQQVERGLDGRPKKRRLYN